MRTLAFIEMKHSRPPDLKSASHLLGLQGPQQTLDDLFLKKAFYQHSGFIFFVQNMVILAIVMTRQCTIRKEGIEIQNPWKDFIRTNVHRTVFHLIFINKRPQDFWTKFGTFFAIVMTRQATNVQFERKALKCALFTKDSSPSFCLTVFFDLPFRFLLL